ncbi:hypothetical protein [Lactiplantibacillus daowaiensis]|uniref:Uncharacterized protein n=1 Tax=Lactiplantibacillus daowaiensis TaxID=2559918 RepID=A0ABW1RY08_9LACO|nr:hypothetical protein [Lactiplantibacillus daowaiensis]
MFQSETPMDDETWQQNILSSLPADMNQSDGSNNQKILSVFASIILAAKKDLLDISQVSLLDHCYGQTLTELAAEYGITRIDSDDDFLRFQVRLQWLKGRMGVTTNDLKKLISTVLGVDITSFDIVGTDNPLEIKIVNLPFTFTGTKREIKRKILTDSLQEMLPVGYLLADVQFQGIAAATIYIAGAGSRYRQHVGMMDYYLGRSHEATVAPTYAALVSNHGRTHVATAKEG